MKGHSVIDPNAKLAAPVKNWKVPPLRLSPEMRIAQERARAAQPPLKAMHGKGPAA